MRRIIALGAWAYAVWVLLTWTRTAEQLAVGAALSMVVGWALAPLGEVVAPWRLLAPRVLLSGVRLAGVAGGRMVKANVLLAVRIWRPSRPLRPGMVITPTRQRGDAGLTLVGLISSLIVDNQFVDVDRQRHELLYHAISVPPGGRSGAYAAINGPLERVLPESPHGDG